MTTNEQLLVDIPAIADLDSRDLRDAVVRTWTAALDKGGYRHLVEVPQSARMTNRSLLGHVNEVNDLVLMLMRLATRHYRLAPDKDTLLAASILHDVDKAFMYRRSATGGLDFSEGYTVADHGPAGATLAAACGVPECICDLVRKHAPFNYDGHLPATVEGTILHYGDLTAFDLAAVQCGATPIHAMSVMLKAGHPLLRQAGRIQPF